MARYWNEMNYPQPTEEELKENANKGTDAAPGGDKVPSDRQQLVGQGVV